MSIIMRELFYPIAPEGIEFRLFFKASGVWVLGSGSHHPILFLEQETGKEEKPPMNGDRRG